MNSLSWVHCAVYHGTEMNLKNEGLTVKHSASGHGMTSD